MVRSLNAPYLRATPKGKPGSGLYLPAIEYVQAQSPCCGKHPAAGFARCSTGSIEGCAPAVQACQRFRCAADRQPATRRQRAAAV